jgi:hypothetical protein
LIQRLWRRLTVGRAKRAYDRAHGAGLLVTVLVVLAVLIILGLVIR